MNIQFPILITLQVLMLLPIMIAPLSFNEYSVAQFDSSDCEFQ